MGRILGWSQVTQDNKTGFLSQSSSREGGTDYKLIHEQSSPAGEDQLAGSRTGFLAEGRPWFLHPSWVLRAVFRVSNTEEGEEGRSSKSQAPGHKAPGGQGTDVPATPGAWRGWQEADDGPVRLRQPCVRCCSGTWPFLFFSINNKPRDTF